MINNAAQHTLDWYRVRLGKITGSRVGDLMKQGRKKGEIFGETAKSYIYQLAAERCMNKSIIDDDDLFEIYVSQSNISSKAIRWGIEQEANARNIYQKITGRQVVEVGCIKHKTIPNFASSPDGFSYDDETGVKRVIEIKSPSQAVYMQYCRELQTPNDLLAINANYFYQCFAHMMCTGSDYCDFVVYNPFQSAPIKILEIEKNEDVFAQIEERVRMADEIINETIKSI